MTNGATKVRRPPALWEGTDTSWQIVLALPISLGLHALLVVILILQGLLSWSRPLPPPSYEVMLVGPIKKGTPGGGAKAAPPGPQPDAADTVKAPIPDSPKNDTNEMVIPVATPKGGKVDPKTARADALARMQREAALKRAQELQAKSAIPAATPGSNGAEAVPNATSAPGGSGEGNGDGGSEYGVDWSTLAGAASYEKQVQAIVNANWLPPSNVPESAPYVCVIRVVIGFDGKVTSVKVESASDNAAFDSSTLAAVRKSGDLPPPPIDLKSVLSKQGLLLRFDNRKRPS